jgi:hypothetical protein
VVEPEIGVVATIKFRLFAVGEGGRQTPVDDGYRPLVKTCDRDDETVIGLCVLRLNGPVAPGEDGFGRLAFSALVTPAVHEHLRVGSCLYLAEGTRSIGTGEVLGFE